MRPAFFSLSAAALSLFSAVSIASARFTFTFSTPSECDNLSLTWTGGTPPFQLLVIPVFGKQQNMTLPSSAFNNGMGSYSFQLPFPKNKQMMLTMSDATGFNSGGSTNVLTVQPSKGGSCDTSDAKVDFFFELDSALGQCRPFIFSGYSGAVQPVTIGAIIPGGNSVLLQPPVGSSSFTWNANVASGTSMIFFMTDAQGRQGGSSDVKLVGITDDSSCLDASSPSSTSGAPSPSVSAPSTTSSSGASTSSVPAKTGISIAALAGTVIGALLFLAVIVTLGLFFLRRKRDALNSRRHSRRTGSEFNLNYDPSSGAPASHYGLPPPPNQPSSSPYPYSPGPTTPFGSNPFLDAPPAQTLPAQTPSHYQSSSQYDTSSTYSSGRYQASELSYLNPGGYQPPSQLYPPPQTYPPQTYPPPDPFNTSGPPLLPGAELESFSMQSGAEQSTSRDSMSTAQRKAVMAGAATYKPSRFIIHTDVEDGLPLPNDDGVVELPPQYSERRGPIGSLDPNPQLQTSNVGLHRPGAS